MHQNYPSKSNFLTWEELGLLARSLAFPSSLFHARASPEQRACLGLRLGELQLMLEEGTFIQELNKTHNVHDGSYNTKVLSKSLELLCFRHLSFAQLKLARVTFQTYEHSDHAGIQDHLLLRALKLCGKVAAPLRVQMLLRHMNRLVADRVMFYELLTLIVSCDDISEVVTRPEFKRDSASNQLEKDESTGLYRLCNFEDELITEDERIQKRLNDQYQESLRELAVASSSNKIGQSGNKAENNDDEYKKWVTPPLADSDKRKHLAKQNKMQSAAVGNYIQSSDMMVRRCQCGDKCSCVTTLPAVEENFTSNYNFMRMFSHETSRKPLDPKRRQNINWLVTNNDIETTVRAKEDIEWSMATKRHMQSQKQKLLKEQLNRQNTEAAESPLSTVEQVGQSTGSSQNRN